MAESKVEQCVERAVDQCCCDIAVTTQTVAIAVSQVVSVYASKLQQLIADCDTIEEVNQVLGLYTVSGGLATKEVNWNPN